MSKKPKQQWQIEVRTKLEELGIGYQELADRAGLNEGSVRQAMCKDVAPGIKRKICDYLGISLDEEKAG